MHPLRLFRSWRSLADNLAIVALLAFGLGTVTVLYTALDRLLLDPLPGVHAETLVRAAIDRPQVTVRAFPLALFDNFERMRSLSGAAAESDFDTAFTTPSSMDRVTAGMVSGNYFAVLNVQAAAGRTLEPFDDLAGSTAFPVVLSYRFCRSNFGALAACLGRTVLLHDRPFTVVGVAPRTFYGTVLDSSPDVWLPLSAQIQFSSKKLRDPDPDQYFTLIGRLRSGTSRNQAQQEFASLYAAAESSAHELNAGQGVLEPVVRGAFYLHDQFARALSLLIGGLALFLLILCANVAGLLMVRAARRQQEIAIRCALGASRARIVTHVLFESLALSLAGAIGGLTAEAACAPVLLRLLPSLERPLPVTLFPDVKIAAVVLALAVALALIFGVSPAVRSWHIAPQESLRSSRATRRAGTSTRILLSGQTALTLVLLVLAALLLRTFQLLRATDPGFNTANLVTFTLDPGLGGASAELSPQKGAALLQRVQVIPGVQAAGFAAAQPMHAIGWKTSVALPGHRIQHNEFLNTSTNNTSSSFFATAGIPILSGRVFPAEGAVQLVPTPVVVNQAFAHRFFANSNVIGKTFGRGSPGELATPKYLIVGLAGDAKYRTLREQPPPTFYAPLDPRQDWSGPIYLYVRSAGAPESIIPAVRNALHEIAPQMRFAEVVTMRAQIAHSLWQERMLATLVAVLSCCSILMAGAGLYGLLAFDVAQRRREFAIRAALGAGKRELADVLLRDLGRILLPGFALGVIAALCLGRVVRSSLYGVTDTDPASFLIALATLATIAAMAFWRPLRTILHADPASALRDE